MRSYEFLTNMCFGPYLCRKVSVDYTVSGSEVLLMSVWTMQDLDGEDRIGECIEEYLTADGKDYFQQLCEQDWRDRKQDEWELEQELRSFIND